MKKIQRDKYINKLITWKDKDVIKIITGIRRCGKSVLLEIFQDYLKDNGIEDEQMIIINLEDYDFIELHNPRKLHSYVKSKLLTNKKNYLFIDEIQRCDNFQEAINSLYLNKNLDIYLTGSNANMLSSEISTYLSGRYVEISMLPLSFNEYLSTQDKNRPIKEIYNEYTTSSSLPYVINLQGQSKAIYEYLEGIYSTIVVKDIMNRKNISDSLILESVVKFVFDNIGKQLSTKKISDTMTSNGRKIDVKTVEKYISALKECFVVYQASRYDIKGKQLLKTLEKYYVVDIGLRYMILGSASTDVGRILENVIYLELLYRDYDVYIGKVDSYEVDFVALKDGKPLYIQVATTVRDENTLERELNSLRKINDQYPKLLLTLDDDPETDYEGILRCNALEWIVNS